MSPPVKAATAVRPPQPATDRRYVLPFSEIRLESVPEVGGKNASLGELLASLGPEGVSVPDGFALTAAAFRLHLAEAGLDRSIYAELDRLDPSDLAALATTARSIRERIAAAPLPAVARAGLTAAYQALSKATGEERQPSRCAPVRRRRICPPPRSPGSRRRF
jgi:pyruvate,water dikinase